MKSIIDQILQWPVIVQGALGSALCVLVLSVGNFLIRTLSSHVRGFSRKQRLEILRADELRWRGLARKEIEGVTFAFVGLIYMAVHYLTKALVMVCLGLIFGSVVPVFGIAGFFMALYYLFLAASTVRNTKDGLDAEQELNKTLAKIAEHESKAS